MNAAPAYTVGSVVEYQPLGGGPTRRVRVAVREADIKNGLPGFEGVVLGGIEDGAAAWGYDDQIIQVEP